MWYDMIWCGMIWYMLWYMIWCDVTWYMIWYDIFVKLQLDCHPMTVVQYTFTQKQYTERHKTSNTWNTKIIWIQEGVSENTGTDGIVPLERCPLWVPAVVWRFHGQISHTNFFPVVRDTRTREQGYQHVHCIHHRRPVSRSDTRIVMITSLKQIPYFVYVLEYILKLYVNIMTFGFNIILFTI